MLKLDQGNVLREHYQAAAFGRLCVETATPNLACLGLAAAAFGRLCVETHYAAKDWEKGQAAAFGRLCVETTCPNPRSRGTGAAAFGRLCVETQHGWENGFLMSCSRLRAAVC